METFLLIQKIDIQPSDKETNLRPAFKSTFGLLYGSEEFCWANRDDSGYRVIRIIPEALLCGDCAHLE